MLVAIIDDGVDAGMYSIGSLRYDMSVNRFNRVRKRKSSEKITTEHGTTVAGIIKKYAPQAELCSIRIFSPTSYGRIFTTRSKLINALKWCLKMKIPLINLSLGTVEQSDFKKVKRVIDKLLKNGQIIVAACNKNGEYTMPAMLPGVLGVRTDEELSGYTYYQSIGEPGVDYMASSVHELSWMDEITIKTPISNSYAAPTITAAVVNGEIDLI